MIPISRDTKGGLLSASLQIGQSPCDRIQVILGSLGLLRTWLLSILVRGGNVKDVVANVKLEVGPRVDRFRASCATFNLGRMSSLGWTGVLARRVPGASRCRLGCGLGRNDWSLLFMTALATEGAVAEEGTLLLLYRLIISRTGKRCTVCRLLGRRVLGVDWNWRLHTGHGGGI